MKLMPSLKPRKRYIVFKIHSSKQCSATDVKNVVTDALHSFLGELGVAKAAPLFIKERFKNNTFIIKVSHKYVDECISALILIKKIKGSSVTIQSVKVAGTLKKVAGGLL
ncbi:TPA: hypothetical protein HA278_07950 [Candidatus Woesearchaeota archaeon]|jgi:RNase P/RNase MRP subunit POP5|nr:hypothetical protein [archaeon]HIJ11965.1 hypothetical protein [Candidatus Woesearchaeota archaeon]